jgi:hypothetical protein
MAVEIVRTRATALVAIIARVEEEYFCTEANGQF